MEVVVLAWVDSTKLVVCSLVSEIEEMVSVGVVANEVNCIGVEKEDSDSIFGRVNGSERTSTFIKNKKIC